MPSSENTSNSTYHLYSLSTVVPMSITIVIFIILTVCGNLMVILTVARHRSMRTRTNMFIVNLAIADILTAILNMPFSLTTIISGDWILDKAMCKINGFTMALLLICSIHTLMYISIHKYISITKPFSRAMNPKRIKIMISAAWIWSFICAILPLVGMNEIIYKKGSSQCGPNYPDEPRDYIHSILITTTNYIIPLGVMTFCYFHIFREIHDHMNRIRETSNINLQNSVSQQKRISITLFLVLACFLLCWTPFVLYSSAAAVIKDKAKIPFIINPIAYWCGYLNSACNPIIYAFRSPSFRQGYKEIMCGYQGPILSGGSSIRASFRSRQGSSKSPTFISGRMRFTLTNWSKKTQELHAKQPPPKKRFLSQTSWISLPCLPMGIKRINTNAPQICDKKTEDEKDPCKISLNGSKPNGLCVGIGGESPNKLSPILENRFSKSCPSLKDENNQSPPPERKKSYSSTENLRIVIKRKSQEMEDIAESVI